MSSVDVGDGERTQDDSCDASLQQKHAAMLQRLSMKEDDRLRKSAARRGGLLASENPSESTDRFVSDFSESTKALEQTLASLQQMVTSGADTTMAKSDLDKLAIRIAELEQFLAERSYFLPAYEVRTSQTTISALRDKVECLNADLVPKKRFSFKSKGGRERKPIETVPVPATQHTSRNASNSRKAMSSAQDLKATCTEAAKDADGFLLRMACAIHDLEGVSVVRDLKNQEDSEVVLEKLTNCSVYLRGTCRAMYAHNLRSCKVYAGPVSGSALIEEVEDCTMMLASQQIRIHHAKKTDMYLRVLSRPIVEYTSDVRFAPYTFSYSGIDGDLEMASLHEETGLWQQVDDFRWLRATPSPNWCILPEVDRVAPVDGSSF